MTFLQQLQNLPLDFVILHNEALIDWSIGQRRTWGRIDGVLDLIMQRHPCGGGEDVLVLLHDLVHLLLSCGGALSGGRGHRLLLSLRAYHQENKFLGFGNELTALFCSNQRDAVGGATSGILYNLFPKVTITARGIHSYTTCCLHKYGWPNNTSQTSRGATSNNTSSLKGLMLYGRRHCWFTQRSRPW